MSPKAKQIFDVAMSLEPSERRALLDMLQRVTPGDDHEPVDPVLLKELDRRWQDYIDGKSKPVDGDAILQAMIENDPD